MRIFDFGTFTRPIDDENRYIDILAYGKILYNALVQAYAFAPGRHCRAHRFALNKAQLVSTVDLITGASPGVSSALRECFSLETSSSFDDIARVVRLLHAALLELRAGKKLAPINHREQYRLSRSSLTVVRNERLLDGVA